MKKYTEEKSLVKFNEEGIFYQVKKFFKSLFHRNESIEKVTVMSENNNIIKEKKESDKTFFKNEVKKIENEETKLLRLQKQYRSGEIKEEELSEEQVSILCQLYDKQIDALKKSNRDRKQKLLMYRKNTN